MINWKEYKVGEMIDCNPTVKLKKGNEYPIIDIDKIEIGRRFVTNKETAIYDGQSSSKFQNGDTLLARITPCLENGKVATCKIDSEYGFGSTEFFVFRGLKDKTDNDFVFYFMSSSFIRKLAANSMTGASGRQRADLDFIKNRKFFFPPLPTQQKIAGILSKYDEAIENNSRRIKLLEQMAQNLYKEWFVRFRFPGWQRAEFENGVPKGWKYRNLFDVVDVTYGYAFASELFCDDKTLNPVVRIRDILDNHTNTFTSESCTDKYIIKENEILIGMDGIFHMCMWNGEKAYQNQRVVKLTSKTDKISNYFVFLAVQPQVKFWEQTIAGTTVAHLGDKHLKRMSILIPSEEILKTATINFNLLMKQKNFLFKQSQNLTRQRDLLLPRLMSGKLQVPLDTQ